MNKSKCRLLSIVLAAAFVVMAPPAMAQGWFTSGKSSGGKDMKKARRNYGLYCATCHGDNGGGDGPLAAELDPRPRDHTDSAYMSTRTDEQLFKVINEGGQALGLSEGMPPHNTIVSKDDVEGLVEYLRVLCDCKYEGK